MRRAQIFLLTYLGKATVSRYCKFGLVNVSDSQTSLRRILKQQFRNDSETHSRNENEELTSRTLFENEEMQNGFRVYIA